MNRKAEADRAILAVWRLEQPRLITSLARMLRDVTLAEELTQDALVAALERWPTAGVPDRPGAWLMAVARRRALDHLRHGRMAAGKHALLAHELQADQQAMPDQDDTLDDGFGDELLRLVFTACHPHLSPEARAALALRMVCGLTTEEIARAFLARPAAIAQRIVRAKRAIADAGLVYETPRGEELVARLSSVLEVIYLIFNEGYIASRGEDLMRPQLCHEALRLGRMLVALTPGESEAWGLLALMELNASRTAARIDSRGNPVLILNQDRALWDQIQIRRGLIVLARAHELGGGDSPYALQAAIVACHVRAARAEETDWRGIAALYRRLAIVAPSPIVELNRAVAVGIAESPQAGLAIIDGLAKDPALEGYHLLPSVRGDLLERLGRRQEARMAFEAAAAMTGNRRERELLLKRATDVGASNS